ncbi:MAG: T9SS type A sorting domain-containing protein, partial [Saprospiraceae bacterium]|nr:T9SS type A sorting domain-containing protein [Saprospiraceae bacterium]
MSNIEKENYVAKIFTFSGMQIMQTNVVDGTINISDLKRGNYILTISDRYGKNVSSQIVV